MGKISPKCIKILKTLNLYFCFITLGLSMAVPGPCLLDLENITNTDTEHIGFIYTARSTGYVIGSILGGILLDSIRHKQAVLTICNFLIASSLLGVPWSRNLGTLTGLMAVMGLASGAVDTGGNVVCLTLWGSESGPYYQALHLAYGLGGLAAPLIAAPFLGDYSEETYAPTGENSTYFLNFTNSSSELLNYNSSSNLDVESNIIYPFSMIGGFGLFVTILFLVVCIISPVEQKKSRTKDTKDTKDDKSSLVFLLTVVFLNCLFIFVHAGTEIGYPQMLTTYVVKGRLQLSSSEGSFMTSAYWAAFTVSRLASVFLAIKVDNFTLMICDLAISLVGSFVLFLASYEWAIWLASVLLGAGVAPIFPAAIAWLDSYVMVTNKIASFFAVGTAAGEMVVPFAISYFIETIPDVLIYEVNASRVSSCLVIFILYLILRKRAKRIVRQEVEHLVANNSTINT